MRAHPKARALSLSLPSYRRSFDQNALYSQPIKHTTIGRSPRRPHPPLLHLACSAHPVHVHDGRSGRLHRTNPSSKTQSLSTSARPRLCYIRTSHSLPDLGTILVTCLSRCSGCHSHPDDLRCHDLESQDSRRETRHAHTLSVVLDLFRLVPHHLSAGYSAAHGPIRSNVWRLQLVREHLGRRVLDTTAAKACQHGFLLFGTCRILCNHQLLHFEVRA